MAVPYSRIRLVFGGTITSSQTWSTSVTVCSSDGSSLSVNQGYLDTWTQNRVVNIRDWWTTVTSTRSIASFNAAGTTLSYAKAYLIPANSDQAVLQSVPTFGTTLAGTSGVPLPAQTCMVASLRSSVPGRSGRGRMYVPATGAPLGANFRFAANDTLASATSTAALIGAVGASKYQDADLDAIVASTAGRRVILSVQVDDDPDIQRRRSDKLLPTTRSTVAVSQ